MRALCLTLLLCACAARHPSGGEAPAASESSAGDEPRAAGEVRCDKERMPGSHIKREVCRSDKQDEAARSDTERALRSGPGSGPASEGGMR